MSVLGDPKAKNGFSEEGTQPRGAIDQADLSRLGHCPYVRIEHGLAVPPRPAASHMLHARRGQSSSDISSAFGSRWCRFGSPWWKQILCFIDDFLAKVPAQILRSPQVDPAPIEQGRKLPFKSGHGKEAGRAARQELNQKIKIALRCGVGMERGSEDGETLDAVLKAEGGQAFRVEVRGCYCCLRVASSSPHGRTEICLNPRNPVLMALWGLADAGTGRSTSVSLCRP